jgi:hypothetical protein
VVAVAKLDADETVVGDNGDQGEGGDSGDVPPPDAGPAPSGDGGASE